jgi:ribosomal protein S18 acetylase RimI-like enzyme
LTDTAAHTGQTSENAGHAVGPGETNAVYQIELLDAHQAAALTADILRMYRAAFAVAPWNKLDMSIETFATDIFPRHLRREGFALAAAKSASGELLGFCYGYIGDHGQYWTDYVAARIHPSLEKAWLGGHFELAELAVVQEWRGKGIGRALLTTLLDSRGEDRIALQTLAKTSDALSLYESLGFTPFGEFDDFVVLGLRKNS